MIGTVEVLDSLTVILAELLSKGLLILIVKFKIGLLEDGILLHYLVKDVDIEGESFGAL